MKPSGSTDAGRDAAKRAALALVAVLEAEAARHFAAQMRNRAELDRLWNRDRTFDEGPMTQGCFGIIELAGTARIGQTRASTQLFHGTRYVTVLTRTLAKLESGEMYVESAKLLMELTRNCTEEVAAEVERRVVDTIARMGTTDARRIIEPVIPQVEADLDPELTQERLDLAAKGARVWTRDLPDGMGQIGVELDVLSMRRWSLDFEELVRARVLADKRSGTKRPIDQVRAEVFASLPAQLIALIQAIQRGDVEQLLQIARLDPEAAQHLEDLAHAAPEAVTEPTGTDAVPPPTDADEPCWGDEPAEAPDDDDVADGATEQVGELLSELREEPPEGEDEGPPDPADDTGEPPGAWLEWSASELAIRVLGLTVHPPPLLNLHVPMSTVLELDNRPATVEGGGILPAQHVRLLIPSMSLRRIYVDPQSSIPIGIDPAIHPPLTPSAEPSVTHDAATSSPRKNRRRDGAKTRAETRAPELAEQVLTPRPTPSPSARPPAARDPRRGLLLEPALHIDIEEAAHDPSTSLRRLVNLRDQRCIGIGCSHPARRCHHDHETAHPTGPTAAWNLSAKSARCHRAKHAGWTVHYPREGPGAGTITWTSPLGHSYSRPGPWAHLP